MHDVPSFGLLILAAAAGILLAVLSNRLSARIQLPAPILFFAGAATVAQLTPALHAVAPHTVDRIVTVALIVILFDGGMHIGWTRFRAAAGPIALTGVAGTFLTAGATAALAHLVLDVDWWVALLVGTAVAPTDPAVVFSVLGKREVAGRSGTILEGESGANDPVGIALMASLLTAGGVSIHALGHVGVDFAVQMLVGGAVGIVGGRLLLAFMQRVALPSEGLYPLRTLAGALLLYGAATAAGGSGFLAVFAAGVLIGESRAPYKRDIERFHSAIASLGEIVAFVVLGLTVDLDRLTNVDVLVPGAVIGAALALIIRPLLVGACLGGVELRGNERAFVLWSGLKGAVPILLGTFLLTENVPDAPRLYAVIVVVVTFSVLVQGASVPAVARLLHVPMRTIEPEPWALGVRLRDEPHGVHRMVISPGSPADGCTIADLTQIGEDVWISFVVRHGTLIPVHADTCLQAGDDVLVLGGPDQQEALAAAFTRAAPEPA